MLNLYSVYSSQQKKAAALDYPFPYDSRNNLKIIKEWKSANRATVLANLVKILERVTLEVYAEVFPIIKSVPPEIDYSKLSPLSILTRRIAKLFRIINEYNTNLQRSGFMKIKDVIEYPLFYARIPNITNRCSLKILSTLNIVKKFKANYAHSSRRNKANLNMLKVRLLMAKCENILSKKDVPKPKYNAFRAWYLQSFLYKLATLNLDQVRVASSYKKYTIHIMVTILKGKLREIFFDLKTANKDLYQDNEFIRKKFYINRLTEGISAFFLRNSFGAFPSLEPNQRDLAGMFKVAQAYNKLKKKHTEYKSIKENTIKGARYLGDLLRTKLLSIYQVGFISLKAHSVLVGKMLSEESEERSKAADLIFMRISQKSKKNSYDAFWKIFAHAYRQAADLNAERNNLFSRMLEKIVNKKPLSQKVETYFITWKTQTMNNNQKKKQQIKSLATLSLETSLKSVLSRWKNSCFNDLLDAITSQNSNSSTPEEVINPDGMMLRFTISNQALVNTKLERRHQKLHEEWKKIKRNNILQNVLMKNYWRTQSNITILESYLQRWQQKVSFNNSKVQEYNQLLEILSNEKDYLSTEVIQLEQITSEKMPDGSEFLANSVSANKKVELSKQIRYLEFLEFQNSNLMELLKMYEQELDFEEIMELQNSMNQKHKRSYSL